MANCSNLFHDFDKDLNITETKKDKLKVSKDNIRDKIRAYFKEHHPDYVPTFYIQGSYKIRTVIRTKDDTCDLDDGIYFQREIGVTGSTLQRWVYEAVKDITEGDVNHKSKCIRVNYAGDYHIDLPVYYFPEDEDHPLLAVKDSDLESSDPKEFIEWFNDSENKCKQLIRDIKYLKAWGDNVRNKMPSGLAFTVLAEKYLVTNDRDDISLYETLITIRSNLQINFTCRMPTTPQDDLFADFDETRIDNFFDRLDEFIEDARIAIYEEKNQLKASRKWKKHLGDRFPEGLDENIDKKEEEEEEEALLKTASKILSGTAGTDKLGRIKHKHETNVHNKPHRFYGE